MAEHKIDGNDGAGNAGIDGLRLVKFENGQFDFRGGPVQYIAEYFAQMMDAGEGKYFNNMEIAFSHQDAGEMVLSVQRKSGKTPIQQRKEAEAQLAAANARADGARDAALVEAAAIAQDRGGLAGSAKPTMIYDRGYVDGCRSAANAILALRDKPAPAVTVQDVSSNPLMQAQFADWFRRNYPGPDTIIVNPDWHAPRILNAAIWFINNPPPPSEA